MPTPIREAAALQTNEVLVEPSRMDEFRKRLDKLNKKAIAFGLDRIEVLSNEPALYEVRTEDVGRDGAVLNYLVPLRAGVTPRDVVKLQRLNLRYPVVKLGSWQVVGKLEALEGGNLIFQVTQDAQDGSELSARRTGQIVCEHCRLRRKRNQSFLLRESATDNYIQVGKSCLKDFTGVDPGVALFLAETAWLLSWADSEVDENAGSWRSNQVATIEFLADASFISARYGFVSAKMAREDVSGRLEATYAVAAFGLQDILDKDLDVRKAYWAERAGHLAKATAAKQWAVDLPPATTFNQNLALLLRSDYIEREPRYLALACSAVSVLTSSQDLDRAMAYPSHHIASPGEKLELE
ncbi:hypothetical protein, partial [Acidovorax sp.]|uniref:hypothetical protein n=1 Tax=Acidovorax sp. TaxID=1872122 RepID=UPI00391F2B80